MIEISNFENLLALSESIARASMDLTNCYTCFTDNRHRKVITNADKAIDSVIELVNAYLRDYRSSIKLADKAWERETAALKAQNAEVVKEAKMQKRAAARKSKKETNDV